MYFGVFSSLVSLYASLLPFLLSSSKSTHLFASSGLLLGQRGEPQVRLDDTEVWEELLGLLILDGGVHNHIVTGDPVDGSGNLVLVAGLEGVDDAQNFGRIAASRGWVG